MRGRQLSFLPKAEVQHGGDHRKGKRKTARPFDPRRPVHLSLRASRARGAWSLLRSGHKHQVHRALVRIAEKRRVRIYRFANVGNHLHLLVQARSRADFQAFLREFAGVVSVLVTGAIKGRPQKFWDGIAWSTIVNWGRQFSNVCRYIVLNVLESVGRRDRELMDKLVREGSVILGPEPGS